MKHWPVEQLLPHAGELILLDEVIDVDTDHMRCQYTVRANRLFSRKDGSLPASYGVEIMAQTIAAWAGWQALNAQRPVPLGLLLGTRHYQCNVAAFAAGCSLSIEVVSHAQDAHGLGQFACRIDAETVHATAHLTVFRPRDPAGFLALAHRESET